MSPFILIAEANPTPLRCGDNVPHPYECRAFHQA
jgi:hypothetical protein